MRTITVPQVVTTSAEISRKNLPPLPELIAICGGEGTGAPGEPRDLRRLYARGVRKLSIRITRVLLPTGISANQTTVVGILIGLVGAALLADNYFWAQITAILLLQLSFVLDFCDGEIARFERVVEGKSSGAGGAYLDWVGHYYIPALMTGALGWAIFHETGDWWWLAAALIVILSLVRVPYSARDHIMWGVYRDKPELRDSDPMVRAAMARMGGDPEALNLEASGAEAMAGGIGPRLALEPVHELRAADRLPRLHQSCGGGVDHRHAALAGASRTSSRSGRAGSCWPYSGPCTSCTRSGRSPRAFESRARLQ